MGCDSHICTDEMHRQTDRGAADALIRMWLPNGRAIKGGAIRQYHELGEEMEKILLSRFLDEYDASETTNGLSVVPRTFDGARCVFLLEFFTLFTFLFLSVVSRLPLKVLQAPGLSTDLIPFGADHLVQTMLQWYQFLPDTIVFRVMALVLRVCQTLVIPSLIRYKFIDVVAQFTRLMVYRTMVELPPENPPPLHTLSRYNWHAVDFLTCLDVTMHEVEQDCKAALFRGCEIRAIQLCSILLYLSAEVKPVAKELRMLKLQPFWRLGI